MLTGAMERFLSRDADPSVRYLFLRDLKGKSETDPSVRAARSKIGKEGWAAKILELQQKGGYWEVFNRTPDLYHPKYIGTNWRLIVLGELGATRADPRVAKGAELLLRFWGNPKTDDALGGKDSETFITGNAARTLLCLGYGEVPRVRRAFDWLITVQKSDGGWHCFPSNKGTIDAWEAMAAFAAVPKPKRSAAMDRAVERGAEFYLERRLLREADGSTNPPWQRLHYPNHYYYDFLVGLDFLTALGYGRDRRLRPALDLLRRKRRRDGTWAMDAAHPDLTPEDDYHPRPPVYPVLLEPLGRSSRWITLRALRVLDRVDHA